MIQEQTTSDGAGDQSKKESSPLSDVKTDKEPFPEDDRIEKEPGVSTYQHESEELYAEDVDQHMAVFPDIAMPTSEVTINGIQKGDPDVPLTDEQER